MESITFLIMNIAAIEVISDFLNNDLLEFDVWGVDWIELVEIYRMVSLILVEPIDGWTASGENQRT